MKGDKLVCNYWFEYITILYFTAYNSNAIQTHKLNLIRIKSDSSQEWNVLTDNEF